MPTQRGCLLTLLIVSLLTMKIKACQARRHDGAYLNLITHRWQTPHVTWGKPYARGGLKVLFVVPRTVAPREIVELSQRFDIQFDAVTIAHSGLFSFESDAGAAPYDLAVEGTSIEEKTEELLTKLNRDYDAFVFANASLDALPREAQYKILKRVAEGAGLLFTYGRHTQLPIFRKPVADDRAHIFSGVPLAGLDFFSDPNILKGFNVSKTADLPPKLVETFQFKQGRVAVINYGTWSGTYSGGHSLTPPERYSLHWHAHYEYYLALVAKALLWTVPAKLPRVVISDLPQDGTTLDRTILPRSITVGLRCSETGGLRTILQCTVRDKANCEEWRTTTQVSLKDGHSLTTVMLPRLKAGGHFLDIIVKSSEGIESWGSVYIHVTSPLGFAQFGMEKEFYEKGETARGKAVLSVAAPSDCILRVSLTDTNHRLYALKDVQIPTGAQSVDFALPLDRVLTIASRVHGELRVGGEVVDARDQFIFVPRRSTSEFRSILWGGIGCSSTGLGWLAYRHLREAGFNAILTWPSADGAQERVLALCDFPLVAYSYRIGGSADAKGWRKDLFVKDVEDACFYNPEVQQKSKEFVLKTIKSAIPYGPALYTLGDENYFDYESGFSPLGQNAFRDYLRQHYGSLEALNREWGADYPDWSRIDLLKRDDAIKQGLWPMVHEHMAYNESEYADYHHFLRRVIQEADPRAWVGAEGSVPGDLEKTIEGLEVWGPYADKRGNELLRSIAPRHLVRGNWWGGYVGSHGARAGALILWKQLISGAVNTNLFYNAIGSEGILSTDLSYAAYFEKMLPELREIYSGIGQLLSCSEVMDDGIAIHWSQATEHSATLFSSLGAPAHSHGNLLGILDRVGLGYRYVTTRMIENGELHRNIRLLFLPCSQAISDREAQAVRRFADAGGLVVADVATGIMSGHCRPMWIHKATNVGVWKGQLDDLFGVQRTGMPVPKTFTGTLSTRLGETDLSLRDYPFRMDTSVSAEQGLQSLGGVPVMHVRKAGKGLAILLNFPFPSVEHPEGAAFLLALLDSVGIKPECQLTPGRGYLYRRLRNGDTTLVGVVRESETASPATLTLARPAYVYDVRAGRLLGKVGKIPLSEKGPQVRLFSLLLSATESLTLQVRPQCRRGDEVLVTLRLETGGARPAGRVARVQVFRPDQTEAMPYRTYVTLNNASATVTVPFALNDATGVWTVRATDVATGVSGRVAVRVR